MGEEFFNENKVWSITSSEEVYPPYRSSWLSKADDLKYGSYIVNTPEIAVNGLTASAMQKIKKGIFPQMEIQEYREPTTRGHKYAISCDNVTDLLPKQILKTISIMKSKLLMECVPYPVNSITCRMTPAVKDTLIQAYRKSTMYGKSPFVASYDEYGRRIGTDVKIETLRGVTIDIINPDKHNDLYISFEGVINDAFRPIDDEYGDLPF